MLIDRAEAEKIARSVVGAFDHMLPDVEAHRNTVVRILADAIIQARNETAEECARIADEAAGPFPGVGLLRPCKDIADKIRERFSK